MCQGLASSPHGISMANYALLAMQWVFSADTGGISPAYKAVAE